LYASSARLPRHRCVYMDQRTFCISREIVTQRWVQAILTAVFFLQSLSLILGDAEFLGAALGAAQTLNLDVEEAAEACVAPLTTDQRFYGTYTYHPKVSQVGQAVMLCTIMFTKLSCAGKVVLTPLVLTLGMKLVAAPFWNWVRRKLPQPIWDRIPAPSVLSPSHLDRANINILLFCYTPLTQAAVRMLVCTDTCSEGEDCLRVLEIDYSISCDSSQFIVGAYVAVATLVTCVILVPLVLMFKAKRSVRIRDISLGLRMSDVDTWFDDLDADSSGVLDMGEVRGLV
jgi:hypothetical protein